MVHHYGSTLWFTRILKFKQRWMLKSKQRPLFPFLDPFLDSLLDPILDPILDPLFDPLRIPLLDPILDLLFCTESYGVYQDSVWSQSGVSQE